MTCVGDEDYPFPVDDCLFEETFSQDNVYTLMGQELRIRQVFGANLGVAAPVWEAALHLCRFLEEQCVELRGKRILELGAGTGVVGIMAARLDVHLTVASTRSAAYLLQPRMYTCCFHEFLPLQYPNEPLCGWSVGADVTLTDLPLAVPQLQDNVSANMPSSGWPSAPPTVLPLSWGENHMMFSSDWDLVLGADIIYLPETYPLLVETLTHLCKSDAMVYLSSKMRKEHRTPGFFEEQLPSRFNVELVHRDDNQNNNIYRASLRKEQ